MDLEGFAFFHERFIRDLLHDETNQLAYPLTVLLWPVAPFSLEELDPVHGLLSGGAHTSA